MVNVVTALNGRRFWAFGERGVEDGYEVGSVDICYGWPGLSG